MRYLSSVLSLSLILINAPRPAQACGGFFCTTAPMNQAAERILFVAEEGQITTHVQLLYSGSAADFAWILPVPAVPELSVSHNELFNQLQALTQPAFVLEWKEQGEGDCGFWARGPLWAATAESGGDGDVNVAAQQRVGPYETAVISSSNPRAIVSWLKNSGYQLGEMGEELLAPYVAEGMYFLALRLASDRELGDLQPIALRYPGQKPMIPIKLTAVATVANMPVQVWILGEHRAIPENYLHARINEARIDWFNSYGFGGFAPIDVSGSTGNYDQVVTEAINEAGGRAFVTDYAGPSRIMAGALYQEGRYDLERLRGLKNPADFADELLAQGFPRDSQIQALLRRYLPIPQAVRDEGFLKVVFGGDRAAYQQAVDEGWFQAEAAFYNNIRGYAEYLADQPFDPDAFAGELAAVIVEPLRRSQELFADHPYLTRLYTTLSAQEMTVDPVFSFNPDLPEVSNVRTAKARWECPALKGEILPEEAELVITLKDGREIRSRPFAGGGPPILGPAAAAVELLSESGPPMVLDQITAVAEERTTLPNVVALLPNFPNPFNGGTLIPLALPEAGGVALHIYNLAGQLVRTLASGALPAGRHQLIWDGRDEQGRASGSGVYLVRLEAGGLSFNRKLTLLR